MKNELNKLVDAIANDFDRWTMRCRERDQYDLDDNYYDQRSKQFRESIRVTEGRKYIKIMKERSVWGFVVNTDDDKKFKRGDILMAAGLNAPTRNAARGNIFEEYSINWTGPHYL